MNHREIKRVAHPLKLRMLKVKAIQDLATQMRRITFTGPDLKDLITASPDDHIKVFFPEPGKELPVVPTFGPNGPEYPTGAKPIMRDYTPRLFRPDKFELDIDFHLHGNGPAAQWAEQAVPGQTLGFGGPRGSQIVPYNFDWYLLISDESGLPSVSRRLFELPKNAKVFVLIEIEHPDQKLKLLAPDKTEIHWILKKESNALEVLESLDFPKGDFFTWIKGETHAVRAVKNYLIQEKNATEEYIKATGYWSLESSHPEP